MKIKKVVALMVVLIMLASSLQNTFAGYSDIPKDSSYLAAVERLASMEIMKGMEDGSFHPNDLVTREQFAAIMVNASGLSEMAKSNSGTSVFYDVPSNSWSVGYINAAVNEGLITGFANGTFGPQDKITLAQAATIVVKALGYTDQDITGVWPRNYIEKAKTLKLLDGMDFGYTQALPRWAVAVMIDRLLSTEVKKKTATEQPKNYAEASGLGVVKEYVIVSTGGLDPALASYKIRTDLGELTTTGINLDKYIGFKVKLLFNSDNKVAAVMSTTFKAKAYTVNSVVGNTIKYYDGETESTMVFPDNLTMYYQGAKKNFKDIRNNISSGSIISVAFNDLNPSIFEYGVLVDPDLGSPILSRKDFSNEDNYIGNIDISNKSNIVVIKNGDVSSISDIKVYDVVYTYRNPYSSKTYIYVFDKKITGRYDEALPSKASVNKIKIDGVTKEIETVTASSKLDSTQGAFNIGDRMTVLTGKDGKIVDVLVPYSSFYANYAVVVNTKEDISTEDETKGQKRFFVKLFKTDGITTGFLQTSSESSALKGLPVTYEINDTKVEIQPVMTYEYIPESQRADEDEGSVEGIDNDGDGIVDEYVTSGSDYTYVPGIMTGLIDRYERKIGNTWFTSDAVIMDVVNKNKNNANDAQVKLLYWDEMPSGEMNESKVMYVKTGGEFGDAQLLILDNLTNSAGQYGILTKAGVTTETFGTTNPKTGSEKMTIESGDYKILLCGQIKETVFKTPNMVFQNSVGDVVFFEMNNGAISKMTKLDPYISSNEVQAVDDRRIKINGKVYLLSPDVGIFQYATLSNIIPKSVSDIKTDGSTSIRLYFDKDPSYGGKVRVITIGQNSIYNGAQ